MLIEYKWRQLAWVVQGQSIMFFVYLLSLMVHANDFVNKYTVYLLIFFLTYFVGIEVLQFTCSYKSRYSADIYNLVDAIYLLLLGFYVFLYFRTEEKEELIQLLAVVNLVSWLRGLSHLRCF